MRRATWILAALALMLCGTGRADAEMLNITVYAGSGTGGPVIFTQNGTSQSLLGDLIGVNSGLAAAGVGAYSFSSLGGTSNFPGTSTAVGGFVLLSGDLKVMTGAPGEGTPITIVLTENGFQFPPGSAGSSLVTTATASYSDMSGVPGVVGPASGLPGSTQSDHSIFTDSTPTTVTGATIVQPSNGTMNDNHSATLSQTLGPYVTPFTLTNVLTISLKGSSQTGVGSDSFTGKTSVVPATAAPEPASLTLLGIGLAGMAGYGWRRRRQS